MLVGYRQLGSLDWQTGVIRRLIRSQQGRLSIGVQTQHGTAWRARLRFGPGTEIDHSWSGVNGDGESFHEAILLRTEHAAALLLEPGVFVGATDCMLSYDKRWHKARLERSVENGFDFERVEILFR